MKVLNQIRTIVRQNIRVIAKSIDKVSRHKITPNHITITGTILHIPIAYFIAIEWGWIAAVLLIIFGLFDTLDGELARLQKKDSPSGMLLDATTDRIKETLIFTGIGYALAISSYPIYACLAALACGTSLCVSYVKAKGEAALINSNKDIPHATLNRLFSDGIAAFEIRVAIVIISLLTGQLVIGLIILILLTSYTTVIRFLMINRALKVS